MYISRLELKKICCFKKLSIDFTHADKNSKTIVFLGNNGTGKTTILRSIALGLCDPSSSAGLLQELYGDMIRNEEDEGSIRIEFMSDDQEKSEIWIETTLTTSSSGHIEIAQETYPWDNFPWDDIFVCGYGAARGTFGSTDIREYSIVDSVISLFNYDSKLQNAELILRRLKDIDLNNPEGSLEIMKDLLKRIDHIMMLPEGSSKLDKSGITVSGPWGDFMPHGALGDGYRAMLALISDFLGWALFFDDKMFFQAIYGILLIDEIEQHLHPDWQRKIVGLLNDQFPGIQFIFTTHSPLIAANTCKLFDDDFASKIYHLRREDDFVEESEVKEKLGELDVDQILSSEAFDYMININPEVAQALKEASKLASKDILSEDENRKLLAFKRKLKNLMFPEGRTLIERIVERDYYAALENKIDEFNKILKE